MKNVIRNAPFWIAGVTGALAGVWLARVGAGHAPPSWRVIMVVAGQLLALSGLFFICVGVSRRLNRDQNSDSKNTIST